MKISKTPPPPYYAVIFVSTLTETHEGYSEAADRMVELAETQQGYLGIETVRDESGLGVSISYWTDLESIKNWKHNSEHLAVQQQGKAKWYNEYITRICKVERDYRFEKPVDEK